MAFNNKNQTISEQLETAKAAIYIRVSTHWQIDKDSLQVQRRELTAYSEMILGIKDYVIFEDPGYSAKNTDRPAYQQMVARLKTGEFSHLLVWKIDRSSRNLLDFAAMYKELKELGVVFVSKNEQFDTSNAIGEAMLKIILVFAELERNMTSERVTAVMLSRANNGQWNGGRIPYGYDYDKESGQFTPNEHEAGIVQLMYSLYAQQQSLLYITRYLNDAGIRTRNGKKWSTTTVYTILTNVFYKGDYLYNVRRDSDSAKVKDEKEWITCTEHHEPIVSKSFFDRTQNQLKRNKRGGVPVNKTYLRKNVHIFAGLLTCGQCGKNMSATLDRQRANGWRPSIYGCSGRRADTSTCQNKYISDIVLGPFVFNYISNIFHAQKDFNKNDTLNVLQARLLKGKYFKDVGNIPNDDLVQIQHLFLNGKTGLECHTYSPVFQEIERPKIGDKEFWQDRKRKCETALNRLQTIYLYGEQSMPEKDYVVTRKRLTDELSEINKRLSTFDEDEFNLEAATDEFLQKASYFVMAEKLLADEPFDYENYILSADMAIPRHFIRAVVQEITTLDGRVTGITFKNGLSHHFIYKK